MKKLIWILAISVIIIIIIIVFFLTSPVKAPENNQVQGTEGIQITSPIAGEEVFSPLKITGVVNGNGWIGFEGQVGNVNLVVEDMVLGQVPLTAKGEWMTTGPINFEANIEFQAPANKSGTLIFHNENPSGDPVKNKTFSLPVKIIETETTTVKIYLGGELTDTCTAVYPFKRIMPKTQAVARVALEELLKGPTEEEKAQGFYTSINPGVKIQSLKIENGIAYVDFDEQLEYQMGGSCRVLAIRSQITETLKQFSTVNDVVISIDGRIEDILQP